MLGWDRAGSAQEQHAQDRQLAEQLPDLLDRARAAEQELRAHREREGHPGRSDPQRDRELAFELDAALTDAMRAAYAAERVAVGVRGYTDRIYRRRQLAKPRVRWATRLAERLLTLREEHRLHGITRVPRDLAA
ncbi:hypothetical protein RIF23_02745 [Lipingzhangella sp. LS1_29]|uniref:Uncharacterized protein n=2 Tax=Lipingzhangella rawalii TaxID=2055835 RepID=A0ABU2H1P2_9ACTN|nr:hypothetical protein [Lipingzhangella rawalii]MDS1269211.1 hypothetical protein [Lipingzhangella rawalii]